MKKIILSGTAQCLVILGLIAFFLVYPSWSQEKSDQPLPRASEKSPNTAFLLSLLGTTVPYAIGAMGSGTNSKTLYLAAGVLFLAGPSLGFFYGGLAGRGYAGVGLRFLGATLMYIGMVKSWFAIFGEETSPESIIFPLYVGAGILLGSGRPALAEPMPSTAGVKEPRHNGTAMEKL